MAAMDAEAALTWTWFRWACVPLAFVVFFGVVQVGFHATSGAGATGEGWLVVFGGAMALAAVLAAAAGLRLPLAKVGAKLAVLVVGVVVVALVAWLAFVTLTIPACAASGLAPASC